MNNQQIAELLRLDPSDKNVELAVAWLRQRNPSSKAAKNVLAELLEHPQIENHFDWLASWLKEGSWEKIIGHISDLDSLAFYDWIIKLLEDNPHHPEAGHLWAEMIDHFRDHDLNRKALHWLEHYGSADKYSGSVAADILDDIDSETAIRIARQCLARDPKDCRLFAALIRNASDANAKELGLSYLKYADPVLGASVAEALLQSDAEKHAAAVEEFFRKHWEHKHVHAALSLITSAHNPKAIKLLNDWLDEHPDSLHAQSLLEQTVMGTPSQRLVEQAWSWCANKLEEPEINAFLLKLFNTDESVKIPAEAIQYARNLLKANKKALYWSALATKLLAILPPDDCYTFGTELLELMDDEGKRGTILNALLGRVQDARLISLAKTRLNTLPSNQCAATTLALMENAPDEETISHAKATIPSGDETMDWLLTAQLVRVEDQESIDRSKRWLKEKQLNRRFDSPDEERLAVLLALLESEQCDREIIRQAEDWLRFRPTWYEQKEHDAISAALDRINR